MNRPSIFRSNQISMIVLIMLAARRIAPNTRAESPQMTSPFASGDARGGMTRPTSQRIPDASQ